MKSTINTQTTEAIKKNAIASTWQSFIVEDLSDDVAAQVCGGAKGGYPGKSTLYPYGYTGSLGG